MRYLVLILTLATLISCNGQTTKQNELSNKLDEILNKKFAEWKNTLIKNSKDSATRYIEAHSFILDTFKIVNGKKVYEEREENDFISKEFTRLYGANKYVREIPDHYIASFADFNGDNIKDALFYVRPMYRTIGSHSHCSNMKTLPVLILSNGNDYYIDTTTIKDITLAFDNKTKSKGFLNFEGIYDDNFIFGHYLVFKDDDGWCFPSIHGKFWVQKETKTIYLGDDIGEGEIIEIKY